MTIDLAATASDNQSADAGMMWLSVGSSGAAPDPMKENRADNGLIGVVDDDASVRKSTKLLLESFGFEVAVFDTADAFLASERWSEITCLVADVQMPGMTGLQLQSCLAKDDKNIPIVFITAFEDAASRQQAMSGGAVEFLSKPFTDDRLLRAIGLALQPCRARDEIS